MPIPRAYIACLASYNAGILHGDWIDLDGTEDLEEFIENIMLTAPVPEAEEWAVHDQEYCGGIGECTNLGQLLEIIDAYETCERKHIKWEGFLGFCAHLGEDPNTDQVTKFEDAYAGSDTSLEAWCERFLDDTGQLENLSEHLRLYFNFQAYAFAMEANDVFTVERSPEVMVFWRQ